MNDGALIDFLMVEDDDDHAELCIRSLRRSRLVNSINRVDDGEKAMAYLRQEGEYAGRRMPEVVLLDLKLPKKNGLEVLKEIRESPELKHLLVVMLTTSSESSDRAAAYEYHVNSYLIKPVQSDSFQQMITDLSLYWGVWNQPPPNHT
ncbi:response regulator [Luteolibacter sp. AS25]|uniref:response regulator n=1 Tax=Luteolibacter sp. AS25 TaxID=3135776 RepID=UPI00398AB4A6